jgi:hypothetical protein
LAACLDRWHGAYAGLKHRAEECEAVFGQISMLKQKGTAAEAISIELMPLS